MSSVKIYMLANAYVDGEQYVQGDEYDVDSNTYKSIGKSCILAENKGRRAKQRQKPQRNRLNILENKIEDFDPKRFLVIKTQGIGNVINITPAIKKIHELFPDCSIDFMCDDTKVDMLKGWDILNKIYEYPADVEKVCARKYDCCLVGVPGTGDDKVFESFRADYILVPNIRSLLLQHEVVVNIEPLTLIGWSGVDIPDSYIPISKADKRRAKKHFPGHKYIAVCAGFYPAPQWERKNWGYDKYARLIKLLKKRYKDHKIVVMGTGADREVFDCIKRRNNSKIDHLGIINAVNRYRINESAAILQRCKFLITNDTGLGHVAGAVGTKTFSIFGATSVIKNHPWRYSNVITLELDCSPCQHTRRWASCEDWQCLDIRPSEVMQYIRPERKKKIKYELAVIMANHDRYSLTLACFHSLLACEGVSDVRFIIINDNSQPQTSKLLRSFQAIQGNTVIIKHDETYGRDRYHETIQQGLDAAHDCRYIMFMPDDGLYNKYLFEAVKKSFKYLTKQIKCVTFWQDDRPSGRGKEIEGSYNKFFNVLKYFDGFMVLFQREYLDQLEIHGRTSPGGSSIWWNIQLQMRSHAYKILCYKETLAEHIGNVESSMHPEGRKRLKIFAKDLNLWEKPKILRGN